MVFKTILAGRLEFGNEKSYQKALQMYQSRVDNFYKTELLIKPEFFDAENFYLNIPRLVLQTDEKKWDNTHKLLEFLAEYAVAGSLMMWQIDDSVGGKKIKHYTIEPKTDKAAVQEYLRGRNLMEESGKENEAIEALNVAIEKYERHALAYERRGYINFQLRNYSDAMYDFTKSIDLNPNNSQPYFGRALVKIVKEDLQGAIQDCEMALQYSIPLQPIYHKARRIKAECHAKLCEHAEAVREYKFYTAKAFESGDTNYKWTKVVQFNFGKSLMDLKNYAEALKAFDAALHFQCEHGNVKDEEILIWKGMAAKKAGQANFKKDWEAAAGLGSKRAVELLETVD
jgi:tetratricopeptide (TPR) repeat protein